MKELSLREIQLAEFRLLKLFDDICQKHNLTYRLIGGTLLGAVRHKGFIPWDDDIDVCMPRKDYEILLHTDLSDDLPPYIVKTNLEAEDYPYSHIKLVDQRIKVSLLYDNYNKYRFLWMDIFPVDGLPRSQMKTRLLYFTVNTLKCIQGLCYARSGIGTTFFRRSFKPLLKWGACFIGSRRCVKWIEILCKKTDFDRAKYVDIVNGGVYSLNKKMTRVGFLRTKYAIYEGERFPIPYAWKSYLRNRYGNYMELPEVSKRVRHIVKAWKIVDC